MRVYQDFVSCNNTESLFYQGFHSIHSLDFTTAFIQPKCCLINIFLQMLDRNRVISAYNASLFSIVILINRTYWAFALTRATTYT